MDPAKAKLNTPAANTAKDLSKNSVVALLSCALINWFSARVQLCIVLIMSCIDAMSIFAPVNYIKLFKFGEISTCFNY